MWLCPMPSGARGTVVDHRRLPGSGFGGHSLGQHEHRRVACGQPVPVELRFAGRHRREPHLQLPDERAELLRGLRGRAERLPGGDGGHADGHPERPGLLRAGRQRQVHLRRVGQRQPDLWPVQHGLQLGGLRLLPHDKRAERGRRHLVRCELHRQPDADGRQLRLHDHAARDRPCHGAEAPRQLQRRWRRHRRSLSAVLDRQRQIHGDVLLRRDPFARQPADAATVRHPGDPIPVWGEHVLAQR